MKYLLIFLALSVVGCKTNDGYDGSTGSAVVEGTGGKTPLRDTLRNLIAVKGSVRQPRSCEQLGFIGGQFNVWNIVLDFSFIRKPHDDEESLEVKPVSVDPSK
jgi:hypothetical protein